MQTLEDYEGNKGSRRSALFLRKSWNERHEMLKEEGFSSEELSLATETADSIRQLRQESAQEKSDLQALIKESQRRREAKKQQRKPGGLFGRWKSMTKGAAVK